MRSSPEPVRRQDTVAERRQQGNEGNTQEKPTPKTPQLSETEQELKWSSYQQLQQLLKRFSRAIALVEGLAQRLPPRSGSANVASDRLSTLGTPATERETAGQGKNLSKKALKTDPHNRPLV